MFDHVWLWYCAMILVCWVEVRCDQTSWRHIANMLQINLQSLLLSVQCWTMDNICCSHVGGELDWDRTTSKYFTLYTQAKNFRIPIAKNFLVNPPSENSFALKIIFTSKVRSTSVGFCFLCIAWFNIITWLVIFSLSVWVPGLGAVQCRLWPGTGISPGHFSQCSAGLLRSPGHSVVTAMPPLTHHITAATHASHYVTKNILQTIPVF